MTTERKPFAYVNKYTGKMFYLSQQPDAATDTEVYFPLWLHPQPFRENKESSTETIRENRNSTTSGNHIPDAGNMTGWIKCSEQLPENDTLCLGCDDMGVIWTMHYEYGVFTPDTGGGGPVITHWMPLPALPEEE